MLSQVSDLQDRQLDRNVLNKLSLCKGQKQLLLVVLSLGRAPRCRDGLMESCLRRHDWRAGPDPPSELLLWDDPPPPGWPHLVITWRLGALGLHAESAYTCFMRWIKKLQPLPEMCWEENRGASPVSCSRHFSYSFVWSLVTMCVLLPDGRKSLGADAVVD